MNTYEVGNDERLSSRSQAIRDGRLMDITRQAGRVGFRVPVAITRAAWRDCVEWADTTASHEAEDRRLHDLLRELNERAVLASELDPEGVALMRFYRVPAGAKHTVAEVTPLALHSGMDEHDMPIITISLASEADYSAA
ncbi:DUF6573 family protein [Castellaniella sp. WN]